MAGTAAANGVTKQVSAVVGQGLSGPIIAEDGATLSRMDQSLSMGISMPTPEGEYDYPSDGVAYTDEAGPSEVFTLWPFYTPLSRTRRACTRPQTIS